mmetsp:Transcript_68968/g.121969  ORF Transcript_68968/g.121969 Transcript_68968/m.121969 type:complete len:661 (-) Transcript_68968:87-2069(-)
MTTNHRLVCARAARHEFAGAFRRAISDYHGASLAAAMWTKQFQERLPDELPLLPLSYLYDEAVAQFAFDGTVTLDNAGARAVDSNFRVMARARPLQPAELDDDGYPCVSSEGANNAVVVHDGRVHRDGRTLYTQHSRFCVDRIFSEWETNDDVYEDAAKPLVDAAATGSRATLIFFGQTGTGKTFTARGVLELITKDIFQKCPAVALRCFELAGSGRGREACYDLLNDRNQVKCLTGEDGNVHVRGAKSVDCKSGAELAEVIKTAFSYRSSECTERNDASSRSHCILELQCSEGLLRVIDLAGSERNFETQHHTRSMAERGGLINYSLLMLKECARIMHKNRKGRQTGQGKEAHVPFRSSRLTHLLRTCFTDDSHKTTVVATLSPSPTDVEHSLNTLQHVGMMRSARSWEGVAGKAEASNDKAQLKEQGFSQVEGRGHGLHSKLQDARKEQLKLHAFNMVTEVGGSIAKKYDRANMLVETFIDARWHREMNVKVEEDLWVLCEADAEVTQVLTSWREEQWHASKAQDISRWDAGAVQAFLASLNLPGKARIPTSMTGPQLRRLGRRGLTSLCSDEETAEMLHQALMGQDVANKAASASHRDSTAKMTLLAQSKVHVALQPVQEKAQTDEATSSLQSEDRNTPATAIEEVCGSGSLTAFSN